MREYFEHAYEGFCNSMQVFVDLAETMVELAKVFFAYVTLPIWIIPYVLFFRKENEGVKHDNPELLGGENHG